MTDAVFRNRGLAISVDTTKEAEFDFELHAVGENYAKKIGANLRSLPVSRNDRNFGSVRVRQLDEEYEVAFLITQNEADVVVLILGLQRVGELESHVSQMIRAGLHQVAPGAAELLKGRRRK